MTKSRAAGRILVAFAREVAADAGPRIGYAGIGAVVYAAFIVFGLRYVLVGLDVVLSWLV